MIGTDSRVRSEATLWIKLKLQELPSEVIALPSHRLLQTRQQAEPLETGKECEY